MEGGKGGWDSYPSHLHCKCNAIPGELPSKFAMSEKTAYKRIHNTYEAGCDTNVKMYLYTNHAL